jgi:hypothetical protein
MAIMAANYGDIYIILHDIYMIFTGIYCQLQENSMAALVAWPLAKSGDSQHSSPHRMGPHSYKLVYKPL